MKGLRFGAGLITAGALLISAAAFSSAASAQASNMPTPANGPVVITTPGQLPEVVIIGETVRGKTIAVKRGSFVQVHLSENLSTGYFWRAQVKSGGVGYIRKSYKPGQAMPGAPGTAVFAFHAGLAGKTTLVFSYGRAAGGPADTVEVTIDAQ